MTLGKLFHLKGKETCKIVNTNNQKRKKSEMNQANITVNNVKSHSQGRTILHDTIEISIRTRAVFVKVIINILLMLMLISISSD